MGEVMFSFIGLLVICSVTSNAATKDVDGVKPKAPFKSKDDPLHDLCANVFCGLGRECSVVMGKPDCNCIEECQEPPMPVCGSDMKTYIHECELYRQACMLKTRIDVTAPVSCEMAKLLEVQDLKKKQHAEAKPVVCYLTDRNKLRARAIEWLMTNTVLGKTIDPSYTDILQYFFGVFDKNRNLKVESMEFMKLFEENKTISEDLSEDIHTNPVLRGYCIDALIAMADKNNDWQLSWTEFFSLLNPELELENLTCELEGRDYNDRDEIDQDCNTCVCACGNWVCTVLECDQENTTRIKLSKKQKET